MFFGVLMHLSPGLCGLNCEEQQVPHPHAVISAGRKFEDPSYLEDSALSGFSQRATVFSQPNTSSIRFRFRWLT
jgi:hypothetical protein